MNSPIFALSSRALTTRRPFKLTQSTTSIIGNAMSVIKWWARIRISGLEQGQRNPTIVSLYELATALGVSHMELMRSPEDE